MADMTATTMATWVPEVWTPIASVTYRAKVVLPPLMDRRWEPELGVGRGDIVNIPNFTQNTGATVRGSLGSGTFGTGASLSFQANTESQTQLQVAQFVYDGFRIPVEMVGQTLPKYVAMLIEGIATSVAVKVDSLLAGDNTNGLDAFTAETGAADNVDVTEDILLAAETSIANQNAPLENRYLAVSPGTRASLLKIETFRNALYKGIGTIDPGRGPGYLGHIYTYDVYETTNLESGTSGKKNAMWHQEAIAYAEQLKFTVHKDINVEDGMYHQYIGYMTYGSKIVKSAYGREIPGK